MESVDVIIPVYQPGKQLFELLDLLSKQTVVPAQIIIMNTEQKYFDAAVVGTRFWHMYKNIIVRHVSKKEFDHARTRNIGVKLSNAPYFMLMTQDAVPADEYLIENLLQEMEQKKTAVAYARQLVNETASELEKFTRGFNYPAVSVRKSVKDLEKMGIKTFFSSNVCSLYRRSVFDELGGFSAPAIFNEDMTYAYHAVMAGHEIAYTADAAVYHSHNYTNRQQFHRNFDLGVSHADHPEIFGLVTTESEGIRLVKKAVGYFAAVGKVWLVLTFITQSVFKYIGYFMGKRYRKLPLSLVKKCSMNKEYWK